MKLNFNAPHLTTLVTIITACGLVACLPKNAEDPLSHVSTGSSIIETSTGGNITLSCDNPVELNLENPEDEGDYDATNVPSNATDNDLSTRWSSFGAPKWLSVDLGTQAHMTHVQLAYYKDYERTSSFAVETSADNQTWTEVLDITTTEQITLPDGVITQDPTLVEFDITDSTARYLRLLGYGNSANGWNSLAELQVFGCSGNLIYNTDYGSVEPGSDPAESLPTLNNAVAPSQNFDLTGWYLSVPTDTDNSDTADSISIETLNSGYENSDFFYTGTDGGMVFKVTVGGYRTSVNTSYTRTELRGMLRGLNNTGVSTQGVNKNNWVFGSAPLAAKAAAGGVDGLMRATLAVNRVTTTVEKSEVGRIIVGQIHANDDEPLRLYYHKLPANVNGSIYLAHEPKSDTGLDEQYYEILGSRPSDDVEPNPENGIPLNAQFSYEVRVKGDLLLVTVYYDGKQHSHAVDMLNSGYDTADQYQYFKAGVYLQDNDSDSDDYAQATFYKLETSHD
jgi:poly(beta-D-mannuronate) lyase